MSRYLRFFTVVGDKHQDDALWQDEQDDEATEDLGPASAQPLGRISLRDSLCRLYSSERFQVE